MRTGLWVLCTFAAAWGVAALVVAGAPRWTWAAPVLISLALVFTIGPKVFATSERSAAEQRRVGRLVGLWSGIEGVAVIVAVNLLAAMGRHRLVGPAVGVLVGLHFLPLARGLPFKPYYVTGAALVASSLAATLLPGQQALIVTSTAAALILWLTCLTFPGVAGGRAGGDA